MALDPWGRLRLVQACDATFPVGGFNHSYGLETYLREGRVRDAEGFDAWLASYLSCPFAFGEGLACVLAMRALDAGEPERLWRYDRELCATTVAAETRRASRLVARRMIELAGRLFGDVPLLGRYRALVEGGAAHGSPALVFSLLAHAEGCSAAEAFGLHGYSVAATLVQNAARAVPLGQAAAQEVLARAVAALGRLWPEVAARDEGLLGASAPGLELAQMLHESQDVRLFMS